MKTKEATAPGLTIEQELEQAQAALGKANADLATARNATTAAETRATELATENKQLKADKTQLDTDKTKLTSDLSARDQEIKDLKAKDQDVDRRAGLKSAEQLRKHGFKPVPEASEEQTANGGDLWAQYGALKDPKAKREFYLKHKDQMQ